MVFLRRILGRPFAGLLRPVLVIFAISAGCSWAAYRIDAALSGLPGLAAAIAAPAAVGATLLLIADRRLDLGLVRAIAPVFPKAAAALGCPHTSDTVAR